MLLDLLIDQHINAILAAQEAAAAREAFLFTVLLSVLALGINLLISRKTGLYARGILTTVVVFMFGIFALWAVDASAQLIRLSGIVLIGLSMWLVYQGNEMAKLKESAPSQAEAPKPLTATEKLAEATELRRAVEASDVDAVKRLLEAGADPNQRTPKRPAPLQRAVRAGDTFVVTALLAAGADPNVRNTSSATPLHVAAERGDSSIVTALLDAGGDPTLPDMAGQTPLSLWQGDQDDTYRRLQHCAAERDARSPA